MVRLAEIKVGKGDSLDKVLRRFKMMVRREGILQEMKSREYYEKPSEKRKKKDAAAKRKVQRAQRLEAE